MKQRRKRLSVILTTLMLVGLLSSALPGVSLAQGNPNEACPEGTVLVAKFEWEDDGGYVFEKPEGNENVVTITGDAAGGDWESTLGIAFVILKGGDGTYIYPNDNFTEPYDPLATSGSFSKNDLPEVGQGNQPDISNIQFCAPEEPPGSLEVTKIVNWNKFLPDDTQTFEICIAGPSYPTGEEEGACQTADYDGGTLTWTDLIPGDYTVTEPNLDAEWSVTIDPSPVTVVGGSTAYVDVINTHEVTNAVTLISFTAEAGADGVALAWETAAELDTAGFNLYQAASPDGPWTQINDALIVARGDAFGASYSFIDTPGYGTFYYQLEGMNFYGASTPHGPVSVELGSAFRAPSFRPMLPGF